MNCQVRARSPLRLSFSGGGTDVPPFPEREGGAVLSATINRHAYASVTPRADGEIHVRSLDYGTTLSYRPEDKLIYDGKLDLVKAAIINMNGEQPCGLDIFLHTDLPPGTGLGSSSAMMVALVGALGLMKGVPLTDYEIADLAYRLERVELSISGGLQDQYASTFGGFNFIEFFKDSVVVTPLRIPSDVLNELEYNLLLVYTGGTRLSAGIIDDQVERYERSEEDSVVALREIKRLTIEMKNELLKCQLRKFAEHLHEEWQAKRQLSPKISNHFIDEVYEEARKAGAIGGKLLGAGGGGYMLLYCESEQKHCVAERLEQMGCVPTDFDFTHEGLETWRVNNG